jgi:branched-chain amino acid transport system substrate-binding protein
MAIEDFGGKVLGRPIEVVSGDHQTKPDVGAAIARNWFDNNGIGVVVDVAQSAVALAVQEVARSRNMIVMHGVTGTPAITQEACTPTTFSWSLNAYAISAPLPRPLIEKGLDTFFFLAADYSFGKAMQDAATDAIKAAGGKVLGSVRFPQNNPDFSSFILQAMASKAKVLWLISAAEDTTNALKQAKEFGVVQSGLQIVVPLTYITNVHALGVEAVQGLTFATPFYWNRTPETRAWSTRFFERHGKMPTMDQAAVYSAMLHYLKAVAAANSTDGPKVADEIRNLPVNDFYVHNGSVRRDGWLVHDFYLATIKAPNEVKEPWDYYNILQTIPASVAAQPLSQSRCPLVTQSN